jgi:hypothetical protein
MKIHGKKMKGDFDSMPYSRIADELNELVAEIFKVMEQVHKIKMLMMHAKMKDELEDFGDLVLLLPYGNTVMGLGSMRDEMYHHKDSGEGSKSIE